MRRSLLTDVALLLTSSFTVGCAGGVSREDNEVVVADLSKAESDLGVAKARIAELEAQVAALKATPTPPAPEEAVGVSIYPDFDLEPSKTAILVIDMNYVDASPDYGLGKLMQQFGISGDYYFDKLESETIPNIQKILAAARAKGMKVVYTRLGSNQPNWKDAVPTWQVLAYATGLFESVPGNKEFEILDELKPQEGDTVLLKAGSGVFDHTNIDTILKDAGVEFVVVTGIMTSFCVYLSAAEANEHGYWTVVVSDATAAHSPQAEQTALSMGGQGYFKVETTDWVLAQIQP